MKILAAVGLIAGLIAAQINAQPHSTIKAPVTTALLPRSTKSINVVSTATSNSSVLPVLPATFHTITTPSTKPRSIDSTFLAHQKSVNSLPATLVRHPISDAVLDSRAEPRAERLKDKTSPEEGPEDEDTPEQGPEDELGPHDGNGLPKPAHATAPSAPSAPAEPRPDARSLSAKKTGGFAKTCAPNWVVWALNSAIWAHCRGSGDRRGGLFWSRLGLDHMLGNDRGRLVYRRDGLFSSSCVDCRRWGTAHLVCKCLDGRGDYRDTSINLDKYIGNHDGVLCSEYECGAREAPPPDGN